MKKFLTYLSYSLFVIPLLLIFAAVFACVGCGGSSSPVVPSNVPIAIEGIGGAGDIPTDSVFTYTFSKPVNGATVNSETFFLVEGASCGAGAAVAATISCSSTVCTLTPSQPLTAGTVYTICLTTGIQYADGEQFTGASATFVTASGSSAPAVSLVVDGWSATVAATGTTNVNPSTMNITFTQSMNDASVTAAGNVTLTCGLPTGSAVPQPTIVVTKHATLANTYTTTMADAYKYQLLACTLAVGTNVTNSSAVPLSSAATYQFQNGCAVSDDFNADSRNCWWVDPTSTPWATWSGAIANTMIAQDTVESALIYDSRGMAEASSFAIVKGCATGSSFEMILHISPGAENAAGDGGLTFVLGNATASEFVMAALRGNGLFGNENENACVVLIRSGGANLGEAAALCNDPDEEYFVKVTVASSVVVGYEYSTDGVNYEDLTVTSGSLPAAVDTSALVYMWVSLNDPSAPYNKYLPVHGAVAGGVTVDGQY